MPQIPDQSPASPPSEGFKVKRNWKRALRCSKGVINPGRFHAEFLELTMAIGGPAFQGAYDEFRRHPKGQQLLAEKPQILDKLLDDGYLATLPKGSLGHAYRDFMHQNRLDAGLYDEAHDLPAIGERLGWDEDFYYSIHRGIVLHDMFHVLGGYGPDVGGEIGVVGFTHGQVPNPGTKSILALVMALPIGVPKRRVLRYWREAEARGQKADVLMAYPYEELLPRPIDEVRDELGVLPAEVAHPDGMIYSRFQLGRKKNRMAESAYDRYVYDPERDIDGAYEPVATLPTRSPATA